MEKKTVQQYEGEDAGNETKRPWHTPKMERLLTQGVAAGVPATSFISGAPAEGKLASNFEYNVRGGPS